jgi:putative DNA primase/helicase
MLIAGGDGMDSIPRLTGIAEAPTLRPDGTVLDRPGYDEATGLLFDPGHASFSPVPTSPTKAEAATALDKLLALYEHFPFTDEPARAVAVAAVLTTLARKAMRAAPLHAFTAPKMASGKTLLATIPAYIATGRAAPAMAQAHNDDEERKRLLAVLLDGSPIILIDNAERPLRGDALCAILTEQTFSDRLLGASRQATVPTDATFLATGNNLVLHGDLATRAVICALDPGCERPEERRFALDLHRHVPEHRAYLATAALTITRAYLTAGAPRPTGLVNFARFEDWSRLVREPLIWLGMADPCLSRRRIEDRDPVRDALGCLLEAWHANFGGKAQTVAHAIETSGMTSMAEKVLALREALDAVGSFRGSIDSRRVGNFIAKHERRIERGLRFERELAPSGTGVVRWKVQG